MPTFSSLFDFGSLKTRLFSVRASTLFTPRKPRHPLLRLLFGLIGLALLAVLLVVGLFVGVAMLTGGMLWRLLRQRGQRQVRRDQVVDAEYRVESRRGQPLLR